MRALGERPRMSKGSMERQENLESLLSGKKLPGANHGERKTESHFHELVESQIPDL